MNGKEDNLWKGLIQDDFLDFIRFIHPGVDKVLDFSKGYEFLDKELEQVFAPEDGKYTPKFVDKLVKVFLRGGQGDWVLLHIEVQGKYRKDFAERMHRYYYRLLDKFGKKIFSYAIFTESTAKVRSDTFSSSFMGTKLIYQFNIFKIADSTDESLFKNDNPFAIIVLAARIAVAGNYIKNLRDRDLFRMKLKIELIKHLYAKELTLEKKTTLFNFIKFYIHLKFKDVNALFNSELDKLNEKIKIMGLEEQILDNFKKEGEKRGLLKGEKKVKEKFVRKLIDNLGYTDQQAADFMEVSLNFVKRVHKQELSAL